MWNQTNIVICGNVNKRQAMSFLLSQQTAELDAVAMVLIDHWFSTIKPFLLWLIPMFPACVHLHWVFTVGWAILCTQWHNQKIVFHCKPNIIVDLVQILMPSGTQICPNTILFCIRARNVSKNRKRNII